MINEQQIIVKLINNLHNQIPLQA